MWYLIARVCKYYSDFIIWLAMKRPYSNITDLNSDDVYMYRYWLFNPYDRKGYVSWLPSIRVHHIARPDADRHTHNHPWFARTIGLQGGYVEQMENADDRFFTSGQTHKITPDHFHRIKKLTIQPVYTLFITWRKIDTWGFKTEDGFIPHDQYELYLAQKRIDALMNTPRLIMTPKAMGASYESFMRMGWTDPLLIEHGYATRSE